MDTAQTAHPPPSHRDTEHRIQTLCPPYLPPQHHTAPHVADIGHVGRYIGIVSHRSTQYSYTQSTSPASSIQYLVSSTRSCCLCIHVCIHRIEKILYGRSMSLTSDRPFYHIYHIYQFLSYLSVSIITTHSSFPPSFPSSSLPSVLRACGAPRTECGMCR